MTDTFCGPCVGLMDRSPIHRVSVADQVAGILRQRILDGTMREAVRILSLEGLLKRNIHRGVTVAQLSLRDVEEIYDLRRMVEVQAILAARNRPAEIMQQLRTAVDGYERSVRARDWAQAVNWDLQFHKLVIHLRGNKRLDTFYQKVIGELRMGMVLVDRSHNDPGALVPVHRRLYHLLSAGKLKQCADLLLQHLDDSEARLGGIMAGEVEQAPHAKKVRRNGRAADERASRIATL